MKIFWCLILSAITVSASVVIRPKVEKAPATVRLAKSRSPLEPHLVEVEAFGELHTLRLRPAPSPLSVDFKLYTTGLGDDGTIVTEEVEDNNEVPDLYHDPETGSAVTIEGDKVEGFITPTLSIQVSPEGWHEALRQYTPLPEGLDNDYLNLPDGVRTNESSTEEEFNREVVSVSPEVFVVVDRTLASLIGDNNKVRQYLSVFWNAVNLRFATMSDPKINLVLAGAFIIRRSEGEPFINENNLKDDYIHGSKTLGSVSDWLFKRKGKFPKYDLAYLMTGKDMVDVVSGTIKKRLAGIAWKGAACVVATAKKRSFKTAMGEDIGAFYSGVMTAAHEVAHNLGSPHDGQEDAKDCSWNNGYIMSYVTGKSNTLFFSPCSQRLMKKYITSSKAGCLKKTNVESQMNLSSELPGQILSMDQQCQKITGKSISYASKTADEDSLCVELVCEWRIQKGNSITTHWIRSGKPAAEGSSCRSGGKCSDGVCK